ncbi:MAG: DUF3662 domain-containing protein [Anaerolineae bacterium]|nr:DUF3662 domain-containing protein [Anaerolineae bacterium]
MNRIERFEALAEWLVEGTFARLFAGYLHPLEVATHLARAVEDHRVYAPDGAHLAPTHYWIYLHPQDFALLIRNRPSLAEDLVGHVGNLARQAGLKLAQPPVVYVEPMADVPPHSARVNVAWRPSQPPTQEATREMSGEERAEIQQVADQPPAGRPFLIVSGERHVALSEPVISLGRALDNDVIIEDGRVSRHHAQLRRRYGRYILYDVGSSGGTTINGYPVEECVLHPGDVISFAGAEVIYGEDAPGAPAPASEDTPTLRLGNASVDVRG